jgi:predicted DNA-binding transcriptional regulator AlpA
MNKPMAIDKEPFQLPLSITQSRLRGSKTPEVEARERSLPDRIAGIDQVLSTHDVQRITGKHRCTIWRWVLAGTFPPKRPAGGAVGFGPTSSVGYREMNARTTYRNEASG